jgi:hypothetical protein
MKALVVLVLLAGVAVADDASPTAPPTVLAGRVTDVLGRPVPHARVYIMPRGTITLQTATDNDGRYAIALSAAGAYSVVIAAGRIHTYRQVLITEHVATTLDVEVELDISGGEVINIVDTRLPPPAVPPKPTNDNERKSLPYSPQAMERDAWARAFLLLDIDERGEVTRLKLLKRPGFDLDQIAIDEAFKLKFEPARDGHGRPIRTYIVWDMEWPSWGWLVQGNGTTAGRALAYDGMYKYNRSLTAAPSSGPGPATTVTYGMSGAFAAPLPVVGSQTVSRVPCAGSGPLNLDLQNRAYRDCSRPDLTAVDALPWITRADARTALAAIDSNRPQLVPGPRRSRVPALIATGVTGALAVGVAISYMKYDKYGNRTASGAAADDLAHDQATGKLELWNRRMLQLAGATVISGAVTAFLWGRSQTRESFSVQPSRGGATLSFGRAF